MRFAETLGADGAMVSPPWYIRPNERELYEHFEVLAGESGLPVVLYNTPHSTGVDVKPEQVARIAELGQVRYKKTTSGDMTRLAAVERLCGDRIKFLVGCDPLAMEQFLMGAVGWIAPCANFMADTLHGLYDLCVVRKDYAKAKQLYFKLLPMFSLFESGLFIQLTKYAMKRLGNEYGVPRRPLLDIDDSMKKEMDGMLAALGLLLGLSYFNFELPQR
jgi:4-hydroxy-tetrahydrodipicolinate synthase